MADTPTSSAPSIWASTIANIDDLHQQLDGAADNTRALEERAGPGFGPEGSGPRRPAPSRGGLNIQHCHRWNMGQRRIGVAAPEHDCMKDTT